MMLNSIKKSQIIIGQKVKYFPRRNKIVSNLNQLAKKSFEELTNLKLKEVQWNENNLIRLELSDGQFIKAGNGRKLTSAYTFDITKKITRVEVILENIEWKIIRINFLSAQDTLVKVGFDDGFVDRHGGRVELFEIADDEHLIGCEVLDEYFFALTWIKMKVY